MDLTLKTFQHLRMLMLLPLVLFTAVAAQATSPSTVLDYLQTKSQFSTLVTAVSAAGLTDALAGAGPFTIWAPTNDAFAALPYGVLDSLLKPENVKDLQAILLYHVSPKKFGHEEFNDYGLDDGKYHAQGFPTLAGRKTISLSLVLGFPYILYANYDTDHARVEGFPFEGSNGQIIELSTVLTPPVNAPATFLVSPTVESVLDTLKSKSEFSTLVTAVVAAGLTDALAGAGPFTIWAPTNDAFAALPKGVLDSLLKPENVKDLQAILLYHVTPKKLELSDLQECEINGGCPTLDGTKTLSIEVKSASSVLVNAIQVGSSFDATNGIIRTVPSVLLPPADAPTTPSNSNMDNTGGSNDGSNSNSVAVVSVSVVVGVVVLASAAIIVRRYRKTTGNSDLDRSLMSV